MWITELRFRSNDPSAHAARLAARPTQRDSLAAPVADGRLVAAGPFADGAGALLLFDVPDRASLDALPEADLYFRLPAVEVSAVREWSPLVGLGS